MKFSDIPYFILKGYFDRLNIYNTVPTSASYLIGPTTSMVTWGGGVIEKLFAKDVNYGFKEIWLKPYYDNLYEDDQFNFLKIWRPVPSESGPGTVIEEGSLVFWIWDSTNLLTESGEDILIEPGSAIQLLMEGSNIDGSESYTLTNGQEIYFRKDSTFYDWIITYAETYLESEYDIEFVLRNYVNTDKTFIYFGTVYKDNTIDNTYGYHIIHYNLQNFVKEAVPEHQRTTKFLEFLSLNFDVLYNEMYQSLKDIINMIDPLEVNINYISYLSKYFDINIDDFETTNEITKRYFVKELINIIKKKGTYSALYLLWKLISNNSINRFNIYDRWHSKSLSGDIPDSAWEDYLNLNYYGIPGMSGGAGEIWYTKYSPYSTYPSSFDSKIMAPHYKVEIDISDAPLHNDAILKQNFIEPLVEIWEKLRPVNRVSYYNVLIAPIADTSGDETSLYTSDYTPYLTTKRVNYDYELEGCHIESISSGVSSKTITHDLNTMFLNIQIFDSNLEMIMPLNVEKIDNSSIKIDFVDITTETMYVLIKKADSFNIKSSAIDNWIVNHSLGDKQLVIQFQDLDLNKVVPDNVLLINDSSYSTDLETGISTALKGNLIYTQSIASNTWTINHNLNTRGILINIFNSDNEKIYPETINLNSIDDCIVTFDNPITGYAVLTSVGNPIFSDGFNGTYCAISSTVDNLATYDYKILVTETWEDSNYVYVRYDIPDHNYNLNIKEMGIIDETDTVFFYTRCTDLYKSDMTTMSVFYKISKNDL